MASKQSLKMASSRPDVYRDFRMPSKAVWPEDR